MTPTSSPKRLVVAINPFARFGASKDVGPIVVAKLRAHGHEVIDLVAPTYQELIDDARRELAAKADALIVVGGDGMMNLGTNLVAGTGVPLGLIPAGTGNDMARALGIPHEDHLAALDILIEALGRPARVIDAGYAITSGGAGSTSTESTGAVSAGTLSAGTGRWFGCMLSAGFDAVVNERANKLQHPRGKSRYTVALLLELLTIKPIQYRITLDGTTLDTGGMLVSVGNGISLGGGMKVTPNAKVDDGLLDVLVVGPLSRLSFLRIFPKVFKGTHLADPRVTVYQAKKIRIEADAVVAYADGERLGPLPIDIEVRPGALLVLAPRQ